jgi:serine protease inhibitor
MVALRRRTAILAALCVIVVGYFSYNYGRKFLEARAYAESDEKASSIDSNLVSANNRFAFQIFKELVEEDAGKNIFISPFSISTALAMTYNGAEGSTEESMSETLEYQDMPQEQINSGYLALLESLERADREVALDIANSIWIHDEFESNVYNDFKNTLSEYYLSGIYPRPFDDPRTIVEINDWISDKTNKKIEEMIDSIDPDTRMFLINAIYFKGDWVTPFENKATKKRDFYLSDGSVVRPDTMSVDGDFMYYSGEDFSAARLPYGRDKIAMYIFLPDEGIKVDSFIDTLSQSSFEEFIDELKLTRGLNVRLPKFRVEYGVKRLNDALTEMGMGVAFHVHQADFSGMASLDEGNLYIDYVDHKAFIDVNEEGTEAAAATVVTVAVESGPAWTFYVDRPFFFVIRDDRSKTILFMGKIENPLDTAS